MYFFLFRGSDLKNYTLIAYIKKIIFIPDPIPKQD